MKKKGILSIWWLVLILAAGLIIRLALIRNPGYGYDVGLDQGWGVSAMKLGLAQSYTAQVNGTGLPNYPPFSIMLFDLSAQTLQWLSPNFDVHGTLYLIAIKIPAILADLGTALILFSILSRWKGRHAGLLAALIYVLHPAVFHDSAFWGQTDSIYTFFILASLASYVSRQMLLAGALIALAVLTKMQAVMLVPLFLFLFIAAGWKAFLKGFIGGLAVTAIVLLPFAIGGTLHAVIDVYRNATSYFTIISSDAYNFWWSMYGDAAGNTHDTDLLFNVIAFRTVGFFFFTISYLFVLVALIQSLMRASQEKQAALSVFAAAAFINLAFFVWNTQMHERYLFPFVALGLPLVFINRRAAVLYGLISFLFYMNLLAWLPAGSLDRAIFAQFPQVDVFFATCQVILFFFFARFILDCRKILQPKKRLAMMLPTWLTLRGMR